MSTERRGSTRIIVTHPATRHQTRHTTEFSSLQDYEQWLSSEIVSPDEQARRGGDGEVVSEVALHLQNVRLTNTHHQQGYIRGEGFSIDNNGRDVVIRVVDPQNLIGIYNDFITGKTVA